MSTSFKQFSLVDGIGGGVGALGLGAGTDQTGNLLNMLNTIVATPEHLVEVNKTNGVQKRRFGSTTKYGGHAYDYPVHTVKGDGNGQAYPSSKPGYLPGNGGEGTAGYGTGHEHDAEWKPEGDLMDAQNIAYRASEVMAEFVMPEHIRYVDRTEDTLKEQFQYQAEDFQRERIKDLLAKGFSEEEIKVQLEKERERDIANARAHPADTTALMKASLASHIPVVMKEDFSNQSSPPGLVPAKRNLTSYEMATNLGGVLARNKAMANQRHEQRIRGQVDMVEPSRTRVPMSQTDILKQIVAHSKREHQEREMKELEKEKSMIDHQKMKEEKMHRQHAAMHVAMGQMPPSRMGDPQHPRQ